MKMNAKIKQVVKNNVGWIITGLLIALLFMLFFWDKIFVTIYPGHVGVLFKRVLQKGTVTERYYPEGLNVIWPWDKMYIYNVRIQEKKQVVNVLSQNGLTIEVKVSIRYYIDKDKAPILHQRVGTDFERKIIIPSTISSVREVVGEYLPEQIYTSARHQIQDKLLVEVVEQTGRIPIIYDDLIVENIKLPDLINSAIETKLRQQQKFLEYKYKIQKEEAEITRKKNEAIGIRQYQNIVAESLTPDLLKWKGIMATLELAKSPNTKVIVVGGGEGGLPVIFNAEGTLNPSAPLPLAGPETGSGTDPDTGPKESQPATQAQAGPEPEPVTPAGSLLANNPFFPEQPKQDKDNTGKDPMPAPTSDAGQSYPVKHNNHPDAFKPVR